MLDMENIINVIVSDEKLFHYVMRVVQSQIRRTPGNASSVVHLIDQSIDQAFNDVNVVEILRWLISAIKAEMEIQQSRIPTAATIRKAISRQSDPQFRADESESYRPQFSTSEPHAVSSTSPKRQLRLLNKSKPLPPELLPQLQPLPQPEPERISLEIDIEPRHDETWRGNHSNLSSHSIGSVGGDSEASTIKMTINGHCSDESPSEEVGAYPYADSNSSGSRGISPVVASPDASHPRIQSRPRESDGSGGYATEQPERNEEDSDTCAYYDNEDVRDWERQVLSALRSDASLLDDDESAGSSADQPPPRDSQRKPAQKANLARTRTHPDETSEGTEDDEEREEEEVEEEEEEEKGSREDGDESRESAKQISVQTLYQSLSPVASAGPVPVFFDPNAFSKSLDALQANKTLRSVRFPPDEVVTAIFYRDKLDDAQKADLFYTHDEEESFTAAQGREYHRAEAMGLSWYDYMYYQSAEDLLRWEQEDEEEARRYSLSFDEGGYLQPQYNHADDEYVSPPDSSASSPRSPGSPGSPFSPTLAHSHSHLFPQTNFPLAGHVHSPPSPEAAGVERGGRGGREGDMDAESVPSHTHRHHSSAGSLSEDSRDYDYEFEFERGPDETDLQYDNLEEYPDSSPSDDEDHEEEDGDRAEE